MASLNKLGKQVVEKFDVSACTDITGFGLLGHCVEMASASEVTFEINVRDIEYFADAIDYAKMGLVPAGAYKNRGYSIDQSRLDMWKISIWIFCMIHRHQVGC